MVPINAGAYIDSQGEKYRIDKTRMQLLDIRKTVIDKNKDADKKKLWSHSRYGVNR